MNINILQWNCRSMQRRIPELALLLDKHNINIATLCETRLDEHLRPCVNNFDLYSCDRNRFGGGVAILVDKRFRFSQIADIDMNLICNRNNIEYILGKIWLRPDKFIYVCSLYSPPRGGNYLHTEASAWQSVFRCLSNYDPIVICGDVNGKSALWSPKLLGPDVEGHKLEGAILSAEFSCLNDGSHTWASADLSAASALDITLTSPSIASRCSWYVLEDNYGSDHFPIMISVVSNYTKPSYGRPSFTISKVDWPVFQLECSKYVDQTHDLGKDLNNAYDSLLNAIHLALLTAGAKKLPSSNIRGKPPTAWWDEECKEIILNSHHPANHCHH